MHDTIAVTIEKNKSQPKRQYDKWSNEEKKMSIASSLVCGLNGVSG